LRSVGREKALSLPRTFNRKTALHTDELMAEVVAKDTGLRTKRRMSHVGSVALIRG
jgi:hypothetical protein